MNIVKDSGRCKVCRNPVSAYVFGIVGTGPAIYDLPCGHEYVLGSTATGTPIPPEAHAAALLLMDDAKDTRNARYTNP